MQKGFSVILILIGILIAIIGIYFGQLILRYNKDLKLAEQKDKLYYQKIPSPPTLDTPRFDEIASWKTYTNVKYGITFKYDEESELQESDQNNQLIIRLVNKKLDFNRNYKDSKPNQLAADNENFFTLEAATNKIAADSLGIGCSRFDKANKITVGGYEGYYDERTLVQGGVQGYTKSICLSRGYLRYTFITQYLADSPEETKTAVIQLFNQTLTTFKFLK